MGKKKATLGRPTKFGERMKSHSISLTEEMAAAIREYGDDDLSAGVRKLAQRLVKRKPVSG